MEMQLFSNALRQFNEAARHLKLHPDTLEQLRHPKRIMMFSIPVRMDDGSQKIFKGYRVQYDDSRGPAKGGIRFHPQVNLDEVQSLAFWMAMKCSVVGIPYGGGKGGVEVHPKDLSPAELERLSRGYMRAIADFVGPDKDIPAPDVYTNETIMAWMADEYYTITRNYLPGVITGKPIALGGSKGRGDATGRGGFYVIEALRQRLGITQKQPTVAIQGFGNAGFHFARLATEAGYKVVAISDSGGGVHCADGIDPKAANDIKHQGQSVATLASKSGSSKISNEELLELEVDLLVPAALEDQITSKNAAKIRSKVVLELANGPTSYDADQMLHERGIVAIPDILANAGGVTVSYYEWVQNRASYYWSESEVHEKLKATMA